MPLNANMCQTFFQGWQKGSSWAVECENPSQEDYGATGHEREKPEKYFGLGKATPTEPNQQKSKNFDKPTKVLPGDYDEEQEEGQQEPLHYCQDTIESYPPASRH